MAIVLVTSYGYEGMGDFSFIKNTALSILKKYPEEALIVVSQEEGVVIFKDILKLSHPNIRLMTVKEYNEALRIGEFSISLYIEGPVFNIDLHTTDKSACSSIIGPDLMKYKTKDQIIVPPNTPVLLMPEYGKLVKTERDMRNLIKFFGSQGITQIEVLRSGFSRFQDERGIYFHEALTRHASSSDQKKPDIFSFNHEADKAFLNKLIPSNNLEAFLAQYDLSLEYSKGNCEGFLRIHTAWAKGQNKDQVVVGIGAGYKQSQLENHLPELKKQFSSIHYVNTDTDETIVLHEDSAGMPQSYTFYHITKITHDSLLKLISISGPVMGTTGDASLAEAFSSLKILAYECLDYKDSLGKGLVEVLKPGLPDQSIATELVHRPSQGRIRRLSQTTSDFLLNAKAIQRYKASMIRVIQELDLSQALIEKIEIMSEQVSPSIKPNDPIKRTPIPLLRSGALGAPNTHEASASVYKTPNFNVSIRTTKVSRAPSFTPRGMFRSPLHTAMSSRKMSSFVIPEEEEVDVMSNPTGKRR